MKCIYCDHDCKFNERTNKKCPHCGHEFAFEPKQRDPVTDKAFQRAIEQVSSNGQVRWGVEHLYYELCRRKRISPVVAKALAFLAALLGVVGFTALAIGHRNGLLLTIPASVLSGLCALLAWRSSPFVQIEADKFRRLYDIWVAVHGAPAGVIVRRPQPVQPKPIEADLADYSFDRAIICDRARTVDLLLANNFHFENNCAVLSVEGYPQGPFEMVRKMLKRNPRLNVYALHDATVVGCSLAHRLATDPNWFAGQVKVIDVGLRPSHAIRFLGLWQRERVPRILGSAAITEWEARWLQNNVLELAAIRPEHVLKRLFKAVNQPIDVAKHSEDVIYLATRYADSGTSGDGIVLVSDADDDDGPADSFG